MSENPYLTGVHTPMRSELTLENLPVTGSIPADFNGRYLRMGPNPMKARPSKYHWFAGDGMVLFEHELKYDAEAPKRAYAESREFLRNYLVR